MNNYTEQDLKNQLKPYSNNAFAAFFQKIWRGWLSAWYSFADKHPKLANLIYTVFFFIVFSQGVTIYQMLVLIFLPEAFGLQLAATEFMWPKIPITLFGVSYNWNVLGYDIITNKAGEVIVGGGLGYFIAFEIATFTAQCINFPLQRNITYRSHGNPWYQAMWYFIGWVLVSLFCNAINGLWIPLAAQVMAPWLYSILVMIAQGGIAMVIFFFIFLVIFPDNNKVAKKTKAKYEKLKAANASENKLAKAEKAYKTAQDKADRSNSEKEYRQSLTQANSKALKYFAIVKQYDAAVAETKAEYENLEKSRTSEMDVSKQAKLVDAYASAQKKEADLKAKAEEAFAKACEAIELKEEKTLAYNAVMERLGLQAK